jgi:gas vesicle structural protein
MASLATQRGAGGGYVQRSGPSGLYEVLDLILDKGLVIDVFVRVSLVGIELLTIDARIVIASVDTYLRFAEAVNRLDLGSTAESESIPDLFSDMSESGASSKTKGMLEGAKESLFGSSDDDEEEGSDDGGSRSRSSSRRSSSGSRSRARSASSRSSSRGRQS